MTLAISVVLLLLAVWCIIDQIIVFTWHVSMLENQFEFSNVQTGLLKACDDIDYLCDVMFAD